MKKLAVFVMLILSMFTSSITMNASSTDSIIGPDVIHKQSNHILTLNDILSMYSSSLGQVYVVFDGYTGNGNILGVHPLELKASNGTEEATKEVQIMVIATLGNVQAVSDYKNIHVRSNQILTPQDIVLTLENTGYIEITATTQMMLLTDTYSENQTVQGQYLFEFRLMNSAGLDQVYSSYIYVSGDDNLFVPDIIFEAPPSWFETAWNKIEIFVYLILAGIAAFQYAKYKKKRKKRAYT